MSVADVFTNDFEIHYDEAKDRLLIYAFEHGKRPAVPIAMQLDTLRDMGSEKASRWVGETLLLLIPTIRREVFRLSD